MVQYVKCIFNLDDFCVNALKSNLHRYYITEIFNTDQRAQYIGKAFNNALKGHCVRINMYGI